MSFKSGPIAFRRFSADMPPATAAEICALLADHRFTESDLGLPSSVEAGFVSQHLQDADFSPHRIQFGHALLFNLRVYTHRVPSALKKAWTEAETKATVSINPSGFASKLQKRDIKESVRRRCEDELRSRKHRRSRLIPIMWDLQDHAIYTPATGTALDLLVTALDGIGVAVKPETPGTNSGTFDVTPTRFALGPEGQAAMPSYPWVSRSCDQHAFLGNEFLEAVASLKSGKVPRRAAMMMETGGFGFEFNLAADTFAISGLKLPQIEDAEDEHELIEARVNLVRTFWQALTELYRKFIQLRQSLAWESAAQDIRTWIQNRG